MIIKNIAISFFFPFFSACNGTNYPSNTDSLKTIQADTVHKEKLTKESLVQLGNIIYNCDGLSTFKSLINKYDSGFIMLNVLHIGDSHIKSGLYSQPLMQKLNDYYTSKKRGNLFFNFQWFCKIGTKYSDYNDLAELDSQLSKTKLNLVIISLGTNDAFSGSSRINFYEKIDHLVQKIKALSPKASILITTPPDALKKAGGAYMMIPELLDVVNTLIKYCNDKGIAYWNLHQVMGGAYTINDWYLQKLAAVDRVHYTAKGYEKFAQWLYEAFIRCMN